MVRKRNLCLIILIPLQVLDRIHAIRVRDAGKARTVDVVVVDVVETNLVKTAGHKAGPTKRINNKERRIIRRFNAFDATSSVTLFRDVQSERKRNKQT
ncbi:hypothetical protein Hanom_Chr16g01520381 [Helianthus anomalus]